MSVDLRIQPGVPYARTWRVVDGQNLWATLGAFEVRSEVRAAQAGGGSVLYDLGAHMTKALDGNDITVSLSLTGAQTRALAGGYYDIILSDTGTTDANALRIPGGRVRLGDTVTAAS